MDLQQETRARARNCALCAENLLLWHARPGELALPEPSVGRKNGLFRPIGHLNGYRFASRNPGARPFSGRARTTAAAERLRAQCHDPPGPPRGCMRASGCACEVAGPAPPRPALHRPAQPGPARPLPALPCTARPRPAAPFSAPPRDSPAPPGPARPLPALPCTARPRPARPYPPRPVPSPPVSALLLPAPDSAPARAAHPPALHCAPPCPPLPLVPSRPRPARPSRGARVRRDPQGSRGARYDPRVAAPITASLMADGRAQSRAQPSSTQAARTACLMGGAVGCAALGARHLP